MKIKKTGFLPFMVVMFIVTVISLSCNGKKDKTAGSDQNTAQYLKTYSLSPPAEREQNTVPEKVMDSGNTVYKTYCLACHQADGSGNPGMYPPLDQTKLVLGEKTNLIGVVLNGLQGKTEVKGEVYYQAMPPHNFLSDQQIADVLTYIRNSFGNSASMVKAEEVKRVRAGKGQS